MLADLRQVWVLADIYENEIPWVSVGDEVEMTLTSVPGKTFRGEVSYIYPFLREKARDVHVRIIVDNPDLQLKPGMFANVQLSGDSLLHSVPLTAEAFKRSFLGDWGQYAVTIGLVLFAFSTAIAWSYYGDRAMTYLFGVQSVTPYRVLYVFGFFLATIVDTSLIWLISAVTLALMTLPNLVGLVMMSGEIRQLMRDYWSKRTSQDSHNA